jgi:ISXO2-like transposase domain
VPFVQASVEPGCALRTDGSAAYRSLKDLGYGHQRTVMLGAYLNEFVFRFNLRTSNSRGLLFYRLLQQVMHTSPYTSSHITKASPKLPDKV